MSRDDLEEPIARAILKCAVDAAGREYPDWESATPQNREIALKCARVAIATIYDAGHHILPIGKEPRL